MNEQAIPADTPGGEVVRAKRPDVTARHNASDSIFQFLLLRRRPSSMPASSKASRRKEPNSRRKKDYTIVKDVFENELHEYTIIERTRGDIQAITIAAARYGKNLTTSVKQSFFTRQRAFVGFWLQFPCAGVRRSVSLSCPVPHQRLGEASCTTKREAEE